MGSKLRAGGGGQWPMWADLAIDLLDERVPGMSPVFVSTVEDQQDEKPVAWSVTGRRTTCVDECVSRTPKASVHQHKLVFMNDAVAKRPISDQQCAFANPRVSSAMIKRLDICKHQGDVCSTRIPSNSLEKQWSVSSELTEKAPNERCTSKGRIIPKRRPLIVSREEDVQEQNLVSRRFTGEPTYTSVRFGDVSIKESSPKKALDRLLQHGSQLNFTSYASILRWCGNANALSEGKRVHAHIIKNGQERETFLGNLLVQMYGKCGALQDARTVFSKLHQRNVFSWTIMIGTYVQHGQDEEALQLFQEMQLEGVMPNKVTFVSILSVCASRGSLDEGKRMHARILDSGCELDVVLGTALVNMYGKCGSLEDARRVFDEMPKRDVVSWNAMIAAYALHQRGKEALQLFQQMQLDGTMPNKVTLLSILDACASEAVLAEGKRMHARIVDSGFESDVVLGNAIINMYGKCGSLVDARRLFDKMLERNLVSWTSMIATYAQHGQGKEAVELFQQMQLVGMIPDRVSFVSILSACSHAGLVDEGFHYLVSMARDYDITPTEEHFNCMIDLVGRAGLLDEAEDLINNMQPEPSVTTWTSLLFACRTHSDVERGRHAAEVLFVSDPNNASPYVALSNIYAAAGRWDDALKVRKIMEDKGLKKQPGHSSIEVKNRVHGFFVGSESHPQKDEIYAELQRLSMQMKEAGYGPDTKVVLHDVEEEEKEHILCYHSEKLAIAFGLISTPPGTPLRIVKNLRVCCDCHSSTKFISRIAHREIFVRDVYRFHHCMDGVCSCADYW